ncbi:MAG: sensor domain-containing diguanylate cyclase [Rhizobium sp.]|nr:MAG: sensor domain-containing diguanylate cyclase [Rhizobium sp.]
MELLLNRLADSVSSAGDLEGLTRPLLSLLESVTGLESTYLTTIDEAQGVQNILYSRNSRTLQIPEGLSVPWDDTLCKRALNEECPYTDNVSGIWGDSGAARDLGIKTYLSQPVRNLDGRLYGTLCGASSSAVKVSKEVINVLGLFAKLIEYQVERERVLQSLRISNAELASRALTDPLTGAANRRALMQELSRMLGRSQRDGSTLQVAFIDLDGFKQVNDRYGHEVGDRFLIEVVKRLGGGIRTGDFLGRYGGDEFVVLAGNSNPDDLRKRLEQLMIGRYVCQDQVLDYAGASVGVVQAQPGDKDPEELLARADAAMYEVKRRHRAQEVMH